MVGWREGRSTRKQFLQIFVGPTAEEKGKFFLEVKFVGWLVGRLVVGQFSQVGHVSEIGYGPQGTDEAS